MSNRAYLKIQGSLSRIEDNIVLTKAGILTSGASGSMIDVYDMTFKGNFA